MQETNCWICAAGNKAEVVAGVSTHVVEKMTEDGKAVFIVCAHSPIRPQGRQVAPKIH